MKQSAKKTTTQKEHLNSVSQFRGFLEKRGINTSIFPDEGLKYIMEAYDLGSLDLEEMAKGIKEGEGGWIAKAIEEGKSPSASVSMHSEGGCCGPLEEGKSPYYLLSIKGAKEKFSMYLEALRSSTLLPPENGFSATLPGPEEYLTDLFCEARVKSTSRILEVGATIGRTAVLAERLVSDGEAAFVQLDETLFESSKEEVERWGAKFKVIPGKLNNLPLPDENCDAVLFDRSFGFISNKEELLEELNRVLKQGGRIVIADFVRGKEFPLDFEIKELIDHYACSVQSETKRKYEELFEKTGFTTVKFILYKPVKTDLYGLPHFPPGTTPEDKRVVAALQASGYQFGIIVAQKTKV